MKRIMSVKALLMRCWSWLAFGLWLGVYPERIFSPSDRLNDTTPDGISMNDQPSLEGIVKRFVAQPLSKRNR